MTLGALCLALALAPSCTKAADRAPAGASSGASGTSTAAAVPATQLPPLSAEERQRYLDLGRQEWNYFVRYTQPQTGLANGSPDWANTTAWDIGGQILATLAAKDLGVIDAAEFDRRITPVLHTLATAPLFRGAALAKLYSTQDGTIGTSRPGWSATDLGRLFVALRILATREPKYASDAERVVKRNDFRQIVRGGYLYGQLLGSRGQPWSFQEGRIGYEQYSAQGFSRWGLDVRNALSLTANAHNVNVQGVTLPADRRGLDRLLSEPFILTGVELGLTGDMRDLAQRVLQAQEARFGQTGQVTVVSEDAVAVAPHYFFYYCVYCNGKPFVVDVSSPGQELDSPRWVSTKAAFGWHALLPSDYTQRALDYIQPALSAEHGWASGVYEGSRRTTATYDINTAAVLLEIADYQVRGRKPLIEQ